MKRTVVMDKTKCGILFLSIVGLLLLWLFKATTEISPVKADTVIVVNITDAALTGDLDVIGDLTISGENMDTTMVDGNGGVIGDRVFHITDASKVVISGLTIQNGNTGRGSNGGGILN